MQNKLVFSDQCLHALREARDLLLDRLHEAFEAFGDRRFAIRILLEGKNIGLLTR